MDTYKRGNSESDKEPSAGLFRRQTLLFLTAFVLLLGLLFLALPTREPVYQGKPLSAWLERFDEPFATTFFVGFEDVPQPAVDAVRNIGSNALPMLLYLIQARDSRAKEKILDLLEKQSVVKFRPAPAYVKQRRAFVAFAALGSKALPALPRLRTLLTDEHTAMPAALAIAQVGPEGLSVLTNGLTGTNPTVRHACIYGLLSIPTNGAAAIPALIPSLNDRDEVVQYKAAEALGIIRDNPAAAIPALIAMLLKTNGPRSYAVMSLGCYGPAATSAVPALLKCLVTDDGTTRVFAHNALKEIGAETNAILSALTEVLTNSDLNLRLFAIQTLGSYRGLASNAVPRLMICLNDPVLFIRRVATNALVAITPELAEQYGMKTVLAPGVP